jgi:hypothetical protein
MVGSEPMLAELPQLMNLQNEKTGIHQPIKSVDPRSNLREGTATNNNVHSPLA